MSQHLGGHFCPLKVVVESNPTASHQWELLVGPWLGCILTKIKACMYEIVKNSIHFQLFFKQCIFLAQSWSTACPDSCSASLAHRDAHLISVTCHKYCHLHRKPNLKKKTEHVQHQF
jgi:hypothetical protein